MNPIDIAGHLDERFRLLTGKRRGRVERHQTLRATVEWSYQLLDPTSGWCSIASGRSSGASTRRRGRGRAGTTSSTWAVTDALASLVAKSMVGTDTGPDGAVRYTMLETLRQFAREQLDEAHDTDRRRRRARSPHEPGRPRRRHGVMGADDAMWLARIRADIDNIRAAIGWALDSDDADDQELALSILAPFSWISQNCTDLGLDLLARVPLPSPKMRYPRSGPRCSSSAGYHHWQQGDPEQARAFVERALDAGIVMISSTPSIRTCARRHRDGRRQPCPGLRGDGRRSVPTSTTWRCKADVARDPRRVRRLRSDGGPDRRRARRLRTRAATGAASGNEQFLANVLNGRAWALQRDDPEGALAVAEEFVAIYRRAGVARSVAPGLFALAAGLRARLGDDEGACPAPP